MHKENATSLDQAIHQTLEGPAAQPAAPSTQSPGPSSPSIRARATRAKQSDSGTQQFAFPLTFDSFTVGSCNALAREAAHAISNGSQASLNQLYLVSSSGLGKSHLARAIVSQVAASGGLRPRYTTADSFTTEFTHAVRNGGMSDFKRKYRNQCDLLVVEDVQLLAGKSATQLEFFHTIQHLADSGRPVVMTGDRYPDELTELDSRMRARIASGFVAEINPPDADVRGRILRAKAAHGGVRLPEDCIELLVDRVRGNVRELEGALIQLVTTASLLKQPINLDLARETLQSRSRRRKPEEAPCACPEDIIKVVAVFFKKTPESLASRSRRRDVLHPRQLAMYLCSRYTDASFSDIGRALERNHPSVVNSVRKVERELLEKAQLRYQVEALVDRLHELGHRPARTATEPR